MRLWPAGSRSKLASWTGAHARGLWCERLAQDGDEDDLPQIGNLRWTNWGGLVRLRLLKCPFTFYIQHPCADPCFLTCGWIWTGQLLLHGQEFPRVVAGLSIFSGCYLLAPLGEYSITVRQPWLGCNLSRTLPSGSSCRMGWHDQLLGALASYRVAAL